MNLRRAVSAAYYALFHFLIDRSCRMTFGGSASSRRLRLVLTRAFVHGHMAAASRRFGGGTLPAGLGWTSPIPPGLLEVAGAFVILQEERHRADYDLLRPFSRSEAAALVQLAETSIADRPSVSNDDAARLYLALLLVWKNLEAR